jgi:hypothetical protein
MLVVTEVDAAAIRAILSQEGELSPLSSCAGGFLE